MEITAQMHGLPQGSLLGMPGFLGKSWQERQQYRVLQSFH